MKSTVSFLLIHRVGRLRTRNPSWKAMIDFAHYLRTLLSRSTPESIEYDEYKRTVHNNRARLLKVISSACKKLNLPRRSRAYSLDRFLQRSDRNLSQTCRLRMRLEHVDSSNYLCYSSFLP